MLTAQVRLHGVISKRGMEVWAKYKNHLLEEFRKQQSHEELFLQDPGKDGSLRSLALEDRHLLIQNREEVETLWPTVKPQPDIHIRARAVMPG